MIKKSAIKNIRRKNLEVKIYKIFDIYVYGISYFNWIILNFINRGILYKDLETIHMFIEKYIFKIVNLF